MNPKSASAKPRTSLSASVALDLVVMISETEERDRVAIMRPIRAASYGENPRRENTKRRRRSVFRHNLLRRYVPNYVQRVDA